MGSSKLPVEVREGAVLDGRFELIKLLGEGNFGAVYRARQLVFGHRLREVALKLFKSDAVNHGNARTVFEDAITLMGLQEEKAPPEIARHLIQVYELGVLNEPKGLAYLAMKLIPDARDVNSEIARVKSVGGMRVKPAMDLVRKILAPLAWMHTLDAPLVHADLKPDNILLTPEREIVLVDFGLAARLPIGSTGGAIPYQAPETLLSCLGNATIDVYAVGLMWYEMLTARHPFEHAGLEALGNDNHRGYVDAQREARKWPIGDKSQALDAEGYERIPPVSELNEELREHPQLENMLHRCLAYSPSERYPNAYVLLNDIDAYFRDGKGMSVAPSSGASSTAKSTSGSGGDKATVDSTTRLVADIDTLIGQGRTEEALHRATKAIRTNQRSVPVLLACARALSAAGDNEKALQKCIIAKKQAGKDPRVLETMADIYEKLEHADMATTLRLQAQKMPR